MKNLLIIFICIILGYVVYDLVGRYNSIILGPSHLKYEGCDIEYEQDYINYYNSSGWAPYNQWMEDSAKSVFAKCLCDKYTLTKAQNIKNYIENLYYEDVWYQENFNREVNGFDTSFLIKYKEVIFKRDTKTLEAINRAKGNKELLYEILRDRFNNSYPARLEYYKIIYALPQGKVPIDTLIKYKEIIFKVPPHYGDA